MIPWTVRLPSLSVSSCPWGFSRQEYWNGLPCPPPGDLPKPRSPTLQEKFLPSEPQGKRTCNYLQIIKVNEVQQRMCQIIYKVNVCTHVHVAEKDSLSTYCICFCILNTIPFPRLYEWKHSQLVIKAYVELPFKHNSLQISIYSKTAYSVSRTN